MRRKWKDARGETLVEVLASILIGALSVALLFTAVMASVKMDKTARDTDEAQNAGLNAAEGQPAAAEVTPGVADGDGNTFVLGGAEVTVKNSTAGAEAAPPVDFYGGKGAVSYALKP